MTTDKNTKTENWPTTAEVKAAEKAADLAAEKAADLAAEKAADLAAEKAAGWPFPKDSKPDDK